MEESAKKGNGNFPDEIKQLIIFLASGAFVKFHKEFLAPSTELPSNDLVGFVNFCHHAMHFLISIAIQVVLLLWLIRIIKAALNAVRNKKKHPTDTW